MKKSTYLLFTFIVLTAMLLNACGSSNPATLSDSTWRLVSYGPTSSQVPADKDASTSLVFDKNGRMSGNVGCNSFSGDFKVNGDKISFGPILSTLMACSDPIMKQESAALKVLGTEAKYEFENGKLKISSSDGGTSLFFEPAAK